MTPGRVLAELVALAARLGVAVRAEPFGRVLEGHGGLCWLDGKALVVMDEKLGVPDRIAVLAGALATFDLESASMPPVVRERIKAEAARGRRKRRSTKAPKRATHGAAGATHAIRATHPGIARARPRKK